MTNRKLLKSLAAIGLTFVCAFGISACNSNNGNGGNNGGGNLQESNTRSIRISVRDLSFTLLEEQVYYGTESLCVSSASQPVSVNVKQSDDMTLTANVNLGGETGHITYIDSYDQGVVTICIIKTDKPIDEFYQLSGKTVYAADEVTADGKYIWSGETAADGVEILIGGTHMPRYEGDSRNFGYNMVHKDSVISAYKEGCSFVDMNWQPYNDIVFAEQLAAVQDFSEVTANGQTHRIKQLGGVTFRLDNRK